jgi:hypothetical protein
MQSKRLTKKLKLTVFLSLIIFGLSFYANFSNFIDDPSLMAFFPPFIKGLEITNNTHLGGEYYFIAKAIAAGKGFSNPFNEDTGPTAWMPPLYPFFLALLLTLFKSKLIVAAVIVFIKNIVLIFTGITIYNIAKETSKKLKPEWILLIYLVNIITFFRWFFQLTHDSWLILFFINLILIYGIGIWKKRLNLKTAIIWGLIGGGGICTSPVIGFTWGLLTIFIFWIFIKNDIPLKRFLVLSASFCLLINSVWTIRNYVVFKSFIPVKSNLFYDAYKSNFVKKNGILDESFLVNTHPIWSHRSEHTIDDNVSGESELSEKYLAWNSQKNEFEAYKDLGEQQYLKICQDKFKKNMAEQPSLFFKKAFNRLLSITVAYYPYNKEYESKFLIWRKFIHALPFCFLLMLILFRKNKSRHFWCAVFIYICFLTPYVLITYYIRYSIPLVPLQSLFVFWGLDLLFNKRHMQVKNKSSDLLC